MSINNNTDSNGGNVTDHIIPETATTTTDGTPIQQDPGLAKAQPEPSEFPPGTFDKFIRVDANINMRCQVCGYTKMVTQPLLLNETRRGTGYIMPQNCQQCEKAARTQHGERIGIMLFITSIEIKQVPNPDQPKPVEKFIGG